jgi:hypothetical protein
MQTSFPSVIRWLLIISAVLVFQAAAADKKAKTGQLSGNVNSISKDKSEIELRKGNTKRVIIYSGSTKFNMGSSKKNSPSSVDQVKEGNYMYCGGTWDGTKLAASNCIFRTAK